MRFVVLRSKAASHYICDKQNQPPLVNSMPTTRQREIQNSMFRTSVDCFFPDFLRAQNMVQVIEGKIIAPARISPRGEIPRRHPSNSRVY